MTDDTPTPTAERATFKALEALRGVPAPLWWDTFKSTLRKHGYEVREMEVITNV